MIDDNLRYAVDKFIEGGGALDTMEKILSDLVSEGDEEALNLIIKMAEDDYGGFTYKAFLQNYACISTLLWKIQGIDALVSMTIKNPSFRNVSNVTDLLSHLAASRLEFHHYYNSLKNRNPVNILEISENEEISLKAREGMVEIAKQIEKEELFPIGLLNGMQFSHPDVQSMQFAVMMTRWFHFSKKGIEDFNDKIHKKYHEKVYHDSIDNNRILLEPFAAKIWSKPRFGENFVPDFLIRSIDDSYTIVEIEKPYQPIITKDGNLSSEATHAKKQVLNFRDWVIGNHLYAKDKFPGIWRPFGLVVIGLEKNLNQDQKNRLSQENESTQGQLKVVGFDWLYNRALSSFNNWIKFGFERNK